MLVKIVIMFFITKFAHGQINGQFWWMNDKIAKYHNTLIPPPIFEDLPEYETDESVKIVFRDSEFKKHNSIFHGRHGYAKLKNHNVPKRDFLQYPDEKMALKYEQSENANNLMIATESGILNKKFLDDEKATAFKPDNKIVFDLPKKRKHALKKYPDAEVKATEKAMPLTRSTFETHPPFASFNDYMNFINVDQKPEITHSDDICTYIRQMECQSRMGLVYTLEVGRDPKKIPNDPQLICCILLSTTDKAQSTSKNIPFAEEHTTSPPKTLTKTPNELNKIVLNSSNIDDYISRYAVVKNNNSVVQGASVEKNAIIPIKQKLNINKPSQSTCTYITEQECLMNHGLMYNLPPKGNRTTVPSNLHLICCILLQNTEVVPTAVTMFAQDSNTLTPKPSTEAANVLKVINVLSNIDDYVSKYGVIKNSNNSSTQIHNGNTPNEIASANELRKNKSANITCTYTSEQECLINNGTIYKKTSKRSQENTLSVCCILTLEKSLQIAIKTPSLEEKHVNQTRHSLLNSKNKFQYIEDFIAKFGVNTNGTDTQHENKEHQPNTQTEISIYTTISYNDIFQAKKTINEVSHVNPKPNIVDKIVSNKSINASFTKAAERHNYTDSDDQIIGTKNIYKEEKHESTGICKYIMKQECLNRKGFIYSTDFGKSIKKGPNDPQLVCCILADNLANSHDTMNGNPSHSSTRTYDSQEKITSSTWHTINKNGIQEVLTTAIPFLFPDRENYIFSYNNQINTNKPLMKNENYALNHTSLNDHKNTQTGSFLKPNIDDLISKYGVNNSKSETIPINKVNEKKNGNNTIDEKNNSSNAIQYKELENCAFINKYICLSLNGTVSNLPSEITTKTANYKNVVCCILSSNTRNNTEQSMKKNIEKKNNFSNESHANLVFFPKDNRLKESKYSTEKALVFNVNNKVTENTEQNESEKSSNICTYIKEFQCTQRNGFVYGIEFGKSTKKGPSDPELVCCILLENQKNNYPVNVVAHTNIGVSNEQTDNLQAIDSNIDTSSQISPTRNVFIYKPTEALSFVFPTEKYAYNDNKLSNVEHNKKYTNKIDDQLLKYTVTSNNDKKEKETEKLIMSSNISPINSRYKRSPDDNSNTALNQRMVLLQRRFTTQPPKPSKAIRGVKIVTPDYDEDPYWNVKSTKFHSSKAFDYKAHDSYTDELPKPGLSGLYSDHGQRPSYGIVYNDDDNSDYEDNDATFGYSTVDPRIGTTKRRTNLQARPSRISTIAPETYDPAKQTVNFQSNPDFHVFENFKLLNLASGKTKFSLKKNDKKNTDDSKSEDYSITEPVINLDSSEDVVDDQIFKDCGRMIVKTNFDATEQSGDGKYGSHPWLALVVPTKEQRKILCYATLIHPKAAITTADCVYGKPPDGVTLIAGVWDLRQRSRATFRIPSIHIHKEYTNEHLDYDLAVLTWRLPLKLGPNIQPACLGDVNLGEDCLIFGWSGFDQVMKSRSKWQRATTGDCDDIVTTSDQDIPRTAFCAKLHSRRTVTGKGGSLICNVDGRQSLVGVAVSHYTSLVLLPTRLWALKAGNFIDRI